MIAVVPRATLHRGVVQAQGFWFGAGIVSNDELRARVLAAWEPGARVFALGEGYIVQLAQVRSVTVATSHAAPLTLLEGTLTSAPLRSSERADLPEDAWLILVEAGVPRVFRAGDLPAIDLADWLDLSAFERLAAAPIAALAAPEATLVSLPDPSVELERRLQRSLEHRMQQSELVSALNDAHSAAPANASGFAPGLLRGLLFVLGVLFGPHGLWTYLSARFRQPMTGRAPTPRAPGLLQRLREAIARALARTPVMQLLARKQAEYLRTLLEALDAQDDLEVLRRAIPLSNDPGLDKPSPALSAPSLRSDFRISFGQKGRAPTIGLGETLFAQLRRSYEAVLERLIRAGRHEEAAFFLAEIMRDAARAVDYLERQGKLRLAAELAEARHLAPGLVVRQWFLAGDTRRAVTIAVREGAFADAISRLERSQLTKEADALRFLQADRLASAGRWLAAARTVAARPAGAPFALRWLELLRDSGDFNGLALELSLDPERFERVQVALEALLVESGPAAAARRIVVAEELTRLDVVVGKPLGRELARELLVDAAVLGDGAARKAARGLADWLGGAFRADSTVEMPEADTVRPRSVHDYTLPARDAGTRPIHDACECGSRIVVALGEAGVVAFNRAGKRIASFDVPAEQLVTSEDGTRLLTLARRGEAWRVSQLDLATRRTRAWGEVRADLFAHTFDGQTWLIAQGEELLLLDVFDDTPSVLRRIPLPNSLQARKLQLQSGACHVIAAELLGMPERLRYELPSWTLRERKAIDLAPPAPETLFVGDIATSTGSVTVCARWFTPSDREFSPLELRHGDTQIALPEVELAAPNGTPQLRTSARSFAVSLLGPNETARVLVGSLSTSQLLARISLDGAGSVSVHLGAENALISDDLGRLLVVDPSSGLLVRDLRL